MYIMHTSISKSTKLTFIVENNVETKLTEKKQNIVIPLTSKEIGSYLISNVRKSRIVQLVLCSSDEEAFPLYLPIQAV